MLTESWVEGKSVEEKDAQPTERTAALWGLSSKIDSRIWVNFTRNGLRLRSRHQEPPHTDVSRNLATVDFRGVLPGLRRRRTGLNWTKVLFSDESKFCISFGNQGPRVWTKGGEDHSQSCLKSSPCIYIYIYIIYKARAYIWVHLQKLNSQKSCFFIVHSN